jgi:hypothetical protein
VVERLVEQHRKEPRLSRGCLAGGRGGCSTVSLSHGSASVTSHRLGSTITWGDTPGTATGMTPVQGELLRSLVGGGGEPWRTLTSCGATRPFPSPAATAPPH